MNGRIVSSIAGETIDTQTDMGVWPVYPSSINIMKEAGQILEIFMIATLGMKMSMKKSGPVFISFFSAKFRDFSPWHCYGGVRVLSAILVWNRFHVAAGYC
ncbi:hypothetical protein P0082_06635 [Candidatus Haliotispira prima]|uniref:Uncharacterized protein n=1 Tax=Candidatus Haliotispira prima TaxID=3034016 RepID=A0ABY8MG16_9SPIO|nr:hypothetical protein P0082_06635 [Candidatus Haliotispira prima]